MESTNVSELIHLLEASYGLSNFDVNLIRVGADGNQTYKVTSGQSTLAARIYGNRGEIVPIGRGMNWS